MIFSKQTCDLKLRLLCYSTGPPFPEGIAHGFFPLPPGRAQDSSHPTFGPPGFGSSRIPSVSSRRRASSKAQVCILEIEENMISFSSLDQAKQVYSFRQHPMFSSSDLLLESQLLQSHGPPYMLLRTEGRTPTPKSYCPGPRNTEAHPFRISRPAPRATRSKSTKTETKDETY